ncbi:hypothetical protein AnigIFM56816_006713 [Aspergillus niger]|nr:hypothetical protein AnigIFM56816_006713 [Aspergillus niger]
MVKSDIWGMDIMTCDKVRGSTERFLVQVVHGCGSYGMAYCGHYNQLQAPETWLRWEGHDVKVDVDEEEPEDTDRSGATSKVDSVKRSSK